MNNRINQLFNGNSEPILSIYFTAGYPKVSDTIPILTALEEAGVELVEIGFPFSDPLADGPTIQQSSKQAIDNGMTLPLLLEQLQDLRKYCNIPVVLMGYLNPVLQYGEDKFIRDCAAVGIDGIIIPDMPLSYYDKNLRKSCEQLGIANICLVTPDTETSRVREIDEIASGFIYMVSTNSITGGNKNLNDQTEYYRRIQQMRLKNPIMTGFGIKDKSGFQLATSFSAGAIVGTAFINHITANGIESQTIRSFINTFRS